MKINQAASELLTRRKANSKSPVLSPEYRPTNLEDALAIQAAFIEQSTSTVTGWKCLLPLAEDKMVVAPMFADGVRQGESCEMYAESGSARIEPEIAFVLGKDLPANSSGYSEQEIDSAIDKAHMALELIQARYAKESGAEFFDNLADCLTNQGVYLGPEIDKQKAYTASTFEVFIDQAGKGQRFDGKHPNPLPIDPVYWLINYMTKRGVSFKAGEILITGSYCGVVDLEFNVSTAIAYEGLGEYRVTFVEQR